MFDGRRPINDGLYIPDHAILEEHAEQPTSEGTEPPKNDATNGDMDLEDLSLEDTSLEPNPEPSNENRSSNIETRSYKASR